MHRPLGPLRHASLSHQWTPGSPSPALGQRRDGRLRGDGWFACGYGSLTPRPRARVAYAGDERIAHINYICIQWAQTASWAPYLRIPSPLTMELSAWAKLFKATMEFDREREGDQGRGQHLASAARELEAVALPVKRQQDKSTPDAGRPGAIAPANGSAGSGGVKGPRRKWGMPKLTGPQGKAGPNGNEECPAAASRSVGGHEQGKAGPGEDVWRPRGSDPSPACGTAAPGGSRLGILLV